MPKIEVFKAAEVPMIKGKPPAPGAPVEGSHRLRHAGSASDPQMVEVEIYPGVTIPVHAHETGEFFYIVQGQMEFGRHTLLPGDSIYVPGLVLYSFRAGPQGVRFINVRPRQDLTHFYKKDIDALNALRAEDRAAFIERNISETKKYYNMAD